MQAEHAHTGPKSQPHSGTGPVATSARLGGARADFVAGLGRKVHDLRGSLSRVRLAREDQNDTHARDELRRKLHALGSAAKMMKFDAMDRAIGEALGTLDRAPRTALIDQIDLDGIEQTIEDLPALAWGDGRARSSRAESADLAIQRFSVLVVGNAVIAEALLDEEQPSAIHFTCEATPDPQAAYDLVRTNEPDLVILDADLPAAAELVEALMDDPLTEAVPVIVLGSFLGHGEAARFVAMGVAKTVAKPTSRESLRALCEDTLVPDRRVTAAHAILGEPTLEELGDRLANEIREAIVGRADEAARRRRIELGAGTEVLSAVWGAIARVRQVVTARTDGAIRFTGGPAGALTAAPLLSEPGEPDVARGDRMRMRRGPAAEVRLAGRRIVVADDDPGVVWFLADLLKTAGCTVYEAFDGKQALDLAYETSPDLVISDILMPKVDGFSLCRALRRDVALRDTPVILLSWKEDLLQRVRELGAGAAGYVRKESDTRAIIARVREALRARGRIEARLREDGEVRGRLDGISIRTLLDIVCATRPEARVSVRDATFLYEVEIRFGAPHRVSRTDGDGGFVKGSQVFAQLLGVSAGRFTVTASALELEQELDGNLASQLAKPIARARAAMSILTGTTAGSVARVRLDELTLDDYLKATPERARVAARRLANGAAPSELVACGCEPSLLDDLLCDLSARGIVTGIEAADGSDLLSAFVTDVAAHGDTRAAFAPKTATAPAPEVDAADACESDAPLPLCTSPSPSEAASLEDAVLREVIHCSPSDTSEVIEASEPLTGTPPAEQIIALGEPTIIDDTVYASEAPPAAEPEQLTPFVLVAKEEPKLEETVLPKRRAWPAVAFVTATGIVAWAVLHFSAGAALPKRQQAPQPTQELPAPATKNDVYYTPITPEVTGQGAIDVSAPADAIVVVDGTERSRGSTKVPMPTGKHDVRIRKASTAEERGCTIDVHTSRVAHVKF
jgi:DNA-binding response OmpR family regulator